MGFHQRKFELDSKDTTKIQPPKGGFDFGRMPEPGEGATKYN